MLKSARLLSQNDAILQNQEAIRKELHSISSQQNRLREELNCVARSLSNLEKVITDYRTHQREIAYDVKRNRELATSEHEELRFLIGNVSSRLEQLFGLWIVERNNAAGIDTPGAPPKP